MRIREVSLHEVKAGHIWRVAKGREPEMSEWEIKPSSDARDDDTVVYSALAVFRNGEVRPLLLIREVGTHEWWGDTLVYVDGAWREVELEGERGHWSTAETFVAAPLSNDPSFCGEYSHERQRAGFARWSKLIRE